MRKLLAAVALCALSAQAQALTGEFGFVGNSVCLNNSAGFNSLLEPLVAGNVSAFAVSGSFVFNPNGTGTIKQESTSVDFSPTAANAGSSQSGVAPFTYSTAGDTFTIASTTISGTVTAGPRTGQTFTFTTPPLSGWITKGAHSQNPYNAGPVRTLTLPTVPRRRPCFAFASAREPWSTSRIKYRSAAAECDRRHQQGEIPMVVLRGTITRAGVIG
jgi:hypothetical protein